MCVCACVVSCVMNKEAKQKKKPIRNLSKKKFYYFVENYKIQKICFVNF